MCEVLHTVCMAELEQAWLGCAWLVHDDYSFNGQPHPFQDGTALAKSAKGAHRPGAPRQHVCMYVCMYVYVVPPWILGVSMCLHKGLEISCQKPQRHMCVDKGMRVSTQACVSFSSCDTIGAAMLWPHQNCAVLYGVQLEKGEAGGKGGRQLLTGRSANTEHHS